MADKDRNTRDDEEKGLLDGKEVSRRDFLKMAGVAGAAVGVGRRGIHQVRVGNGEAPVAIDDRRCVVSEIGARHVPEAAPHQDGWRIDAGAHVAGHHPEELHRRRRLVRARDEEQQDAAETGPEAHERILRHRPRRRTRAPSAARGRDAGVQA